MKVFERLLDADDGLNVAGAEEQEVAEPVTETGAEEQEVAEPVTTKSDAAFAEMRRAREEAEARVRELEADIEERDEALGLYFSGENKTAQLIAQHDEVPVEQVLKNMEAKRTERQTAAELEAARAELDFVKFKLQKAQDLKELKAKGVDIEDVGELGEDFFKLRAADVSASLAFDVIQAAKETAKGTPPKSMGTPKTQTPEKDYFTPDEVRAMSVEEEKKNHEKIMNSMSRWS